MQNNKSEPSNTDDTQEIIQPTEFTDPNTEWTETEEELFKKKLEELRKRDPFIYR